VPGIGEADSGNLRDTLRYAKSVRDT
jgi:hypothetical protein